MDEALQRAQRWIDGFSRAWRDGKAEEAAAWFTEGCVFRSHPFRELENARAYILRWLAAESGHRIWYGKPVVMGDRVAVEYGVTMVEEGKEVTLAGCSVLKPDTEGRCAELRGYWATQPGREGPPPGWGA